MTRAPQWTLSMSSATLAASAHASANLTSQGDLEVQRVLIATHADMGSLYAIPARYEKGGDYGYMEGQVFQLSD